jgi:hypothetical protein
MWPPQDEGDLVRETTFYVNDYLQAVESESEFAAHDIGLLWPDTSYPDLYGATPDLILQAIRARPSRQDPDFSSTSYIAPSAAGIIFCHQHALLHTDSGQAYKLCLSVPEKGSELHKTYCSFPLYPFTGEESRSCHKHV